MRGKSLSTVMFLIGLGSMTKIVLVGSIAFSEIAIFMLAPFITLKDFSELRRDGFLPVLILLILTMFGCVIATIVNGAPIFRSMKVLAQYYALFAVVVVAHHFLVKDPMSLKWFLMGAFISGLITIFAFNATLRVGGTGTLAVEENSVDDIVHGALFWMFHLQNALNAFVGGFYYEMPYLANVTAPVASIVIIALTGISGRAFSLCLLASWVLIVYCGKSIKRITSVSKHFNLFVILGVLALLLAKISYSHLAGSGILGEEARIKYFNQTKTGDSALRMLMSGRMEFFIGMRAAMDRPIIGYGIYPLDSKGYVQDFYVKYGDDSDLRKYYAWVMKNGPYHVIPTHSYMAGSWVFCGIFGLILWLYVLYLCLMLFKKWLSAVPQWFGYFALGVPILVWDIFFSPITNRVMPAFMIATMLIARAVSEKRLILFFPSRNIESHLHA